MPTNKPRLVLYCDPEMLEYLKQWAKQERRPVANLATVLLEAAIADREKSLKQEKREGNQ